VRAAFTGRSQVAVDSTVQLAGITELIWIRNYVLARRGIVITSSIVGHFIVINGKAEVPANLP
jgi:hypothetical protein